MPAQTSSGKTHTERPLTDGETALARSVFGDAIDYARVRLCNAKWIFFQPRHTVMAPTGHIHFHPHGPHWSTDFAAEGLSPQGLFIHELVHVWQWQQGVFLPVRRHPFCRYDYALKPGLPFRRYGIEQQAEIIRHAFLLREGARIPGAPPLAQYRHLLPFDRFWEEVR